MTERVHDRGVEFDPQPRDYPLSGPQLEPDSSDDYTDLIIAAFGVAVAACTLYIALPGSRPGRAVARAVSRLTLGRL